MSALQHPIQKKRRQLEEGREVTSDGEDDNYVIESEGDEILFEKDEKDEKEGGGGGWWVSVN